MKKILLFLVLMLGASTTTFAQATKDAVYLKNGSVIYGQVVDVRPEKQVKIKTADGNLLVYEMNDVERIEKVEAETKENKPERKSSFRTRKIAKGFKGFVEDSYSFGTDGIYYWRGGLNVSLGYQISPYLFVGGGIGTEYYGDPEVFTFPLFADVRVNFINGPVTPFLGTKAGYTVNSHFAGFYFNPMVGCRVGLTNKLALHAAIGYALQNADDDYNVPNDVYYYGGKKYSKGVSSISAIKIQFGFEF